VVVIDVLMIHQIIKLHLMNYGDLNQDLINNIVMIDGTTDAMIEEMTNGMIEETIEEMIDAMIDETTDAMIDEDFLHSKRNNHLHRHQNDGQKKILKQQTIGEQLKRNVLIRKL
jgi:Golgi nucleoside diphosphatase